MSTLTENGSQVTLEQWMPEACQTQTAGASGSLARTSVSPENSQDFAEIAQACFSELCTWLDNSKKKKDPLTCSLRTLRICFLLMEDGISPNFSLRWTKQGMMRSGKFSTLRTSECHKTENAVSLLDILEAEVDETYFLPSHVVQRLLSYRDVKPQTL